MIRRLVVLLTAGLVALGLTSAGDLRMPEALREHPGPELTTCSGEGGGLSPMHHRVRYADGTSSDWLPLERESVSSSPRQVVLRREPIVALSVRDGLGRTATVNC